jgi:hypothetical protein
MGDGGHGLRFQCPTCPHSSRLPHPSHASSSQVVRGAGYIDQPWTPGDNTAQMNADADKLYEFAEGKGMAAPDVRAAGTQAGFSADLLRLLQGSTSRSASDAGKTGAGAGAPSAQSTSSAPRGRGPDVPPAAPASVAAVEAEGRRGGSAAQAAGGKAGQVSAAAAVASLSTSSGPRFAPAASPSFEIGVQVIASGGGSLGEMKLFSTTMDTPAQEKLQEIAHRVRKQPGPHAHAGTYRGAQLALHVPSIFLSRMSLRYTCPPRAHSPLQVCVIDGTHVLKDAVAMYCPSYQMDPERHRNSSRHEWLIELSLVPAITFDNLFSGIWSPSPQGRRIVLLLEPFYEGDTKSEESNMMLIKSACTNFR